MGNKGVIRFINEICGLGSMKGLVLPFLVLA